MSETHTELLLSSGRYREAAEWISSRSQLTVADRIAKAWIELELGDATKAHAQAAGLLQDPLNKPLRARCLSVLGRALGRMGSAREGLAQLQKAVALALEVDPHLSAELHGHYATCLLGWVGVEPALAELPRLRTSALRAGNTGALIEYHINQARISALCGWADRVEPEINAASQLLTKHQNVDLMWRLRQVQSSVAIMDGDVATARLAGNLCLRLAATCRGVFSTASSLANLAYIATTAGDFDEARSFLERSMQTLEPMSRARFAVWGTGIDIGLGTGDAVFAESMVKQGLAGLSRIQPEQSYYQLWFELSRVRWLIQGGNVAGAVQVAKAVLGSIKRFADRDLYDRMNLLTVEGLSKLNAQEATLLFAEVCAGSFDPSLEALAEIHRVSAILTAKTCSRAAASQLTAAGRVLSSAGLRGVRTTVDRTATELCIGIPSDDRSDGGLVSATEHLGLILQLGRHPRVLAGEILQMLRRIGSKDACITKSDGDTVTVCDSVGNSSVAAAGNYVIPMGSLQGSEYAVRLEAPSGHEILLFRSIRQIVRSARFGAGSANVAADQAHSKPETPHSEFGVVVASDKMFEVLQITRRLAPSGITVLITGETGTGKELLAKALHDASPREKQAFIPFNCSACSRDMLDAQLFGYKRGAFTGANEAFQGVIRAAAGGTLFLDEIGEITLDVQPKLLRFLESGEIHPLGEPRPLQVDVRVVAATNADLEKLVAEGRFREDLFYRLNVVRLQVPPLRERREEIPPLVQHYLDRCSRESHKTAIRIADETMEYLILFKWPGNVRQLANEVRRMVALAESGAVLMPEHLSNDIASSRRTLPPSERWIAPMEVVVRMDQPISAAIEHIERTMVQYALKSSGGRLEDAAQLLGLSRKGLYLKRQRLQIDIETDNSPASERSTATTPAPAL